MYLNKSLITSSIKVLIITSLLTLFVGCGQNNISNSGIKPHDTATSNAPSHKIRVSFVDKDGLHIQLQEGIGYSTLDSFGKLVLANPTSHQIYDNGRIQQIKDYLEKYRSVARDSQNLTVHSLNSFDPTVNVRWRADNLLLPSLGNPPADLRWAPSAGVIPSGSYVFDFQITNTRQNVIEMSKVRLSLIGDPQPNVAKYPLIDACTFLSSAGWSDISGSCAPGSAAGGGSCSVFGATFDLSNGKNNSVLLAQPYPSLNANDCPNIVLDPGASTELYFVVSSSHNFIYNVVPEFMLQTAGGPTILSLPELADTLTFTNSNQYSCYGLQGQKFVLEDPAKWANPHSQSWCV